MQSRTFKRRGIQYKFHYIECQKAILIFKNNKLSYRIDVKSKKGGVNLQCSCPGSKYHGYCFHRDIAKKFIFTKTMRPGRLIDRINEEFMCAWLERGISED